ncbi:tryptophan 2,3-dioxygenase [Coprinopsis marcescibilis]|uniref:Tryptophan 2,3-dioxygenase n=1 Tax=Coprinopsis marcescibilis TaxID=230819 RepID=A0A5C3L599_COPMA|nr:tryptophan 2,3-dioxygenase [Coprinopsis marcescibilis]
MDPFGENHFLLLPRPDSFNGPPIGIPDTTTLAAHDFDVDTRTGFMPPQQPISRLPEEWKAWEDILDSAVAARLQLGYKSGLAQDEALNSECWRERVRELPIIPTKNLFSSEPLLRRAHHVLAWILQFYIHSLPPSSPIKVPPPLTVPLLQVSAQLQLPPVVTYSDDVLYNWTFKDGKEVDEDGNPIMPTGDNIDTKTTFTGTRDESEFYLVSARMELKGVEALELTRQIMDEAFVGDDIAIRRITEYLHELGVVIKDLSTMLMSVREGCSPDVFYNEIRPWFRGEDATGGSKWEFEGLELDETLSPPTELSGASAGQSSLIHTLDVFLGVDQFSHSKAPEDSSTSSAPSTSSTRGQQQQQPRSAFLKRMQAYMPRHHRAFLNHLANNPRPIRDLVLVQSGEGHEPGNKLLDSYNAAVQALKEFRDKHMIIAALYIIGPARRIAAGERETQGKAGQVSEPLKGTGGTDLAKFLKGIRDQTRGAILESRP